MAIQNRPRPLLRNDQREPGIGLMMDHLSNLYLEAGIVTPTVIPKLRNPAAEPLRYLRLGGDEFGTR